VGVMRIAPRGLAALGLPLRRAFTRGHLVGESRQVRNTEYRPARMIAADADLIECFRWLAALPQKPAARETETFQPINLTTTGKPPEKLQTRNGASEGI
jgi:hypothetical protein